MEPHNDHLLRVMELPDHCWHDGEPTDRARKASWVHDFPTLAVRCSIECRSNPAGLEQDAVICCDRIMLIQMGPNGTKLCFQIGTQHRMRA